MFTTCKRWRCSIRLIPYCDTNRKHGTNSTQKNSSNILFGKHVDHLSTSNEVLGRTQIESGRYFILFRYIIHSFVIFLISLLFDSYVFYSLACVTIFCVVELCMLSPLGSVNKLIVEKQPCKSSNVSGKIPILIIFEKHRIYMPMVRERCKLP